MSQTTDIITIDSASESGEHQISDSDLPSIASTPSPPIKAQLPTISIREHYVKKEEYNGHGEAKPMVFYPTIEEMKNFKDYMEKIERESEPQRNSGICKIVAPEGWRPRKNNYTLEEIDKVIIHTPVEESITRKKDYPDVFDKTNKVYKKVMTGKEFREMTTKNGYKSPRKSTIQDLEKHYWKNIEKGKSPIYGADTPGSFFDEDVNDFNVTKLGTILDLLNEEQVYLKGVNTPYLYFGMYKTTFAWHAEDMDLYSINYLHFGEPKFWYAIPPEAADKFEKLLAQFYPEYHLNCKAFLRHKICMVNPEFLNRHNIPYGTMVQYPGEFIVTFPRGYHMGFNAGYNLAEATNFALDRWIDFGKNCVMCNCEKDAVKINMTSFMKKYRPTEFLLWEKYWYNERLSIKRTDIQKKLTRKRLREVTASQTDVEAMRCLKTSLKTYKAEDRFANLKRLFIAKPDFENEKHFNHTQGRVFPYCSVCQYFVPDLNLRTEHKEPFTIPKKSPRYTINSMYCKSRSVNDIVSPPQDDELLQCCSCNVVVHKQCYVQIPSEDGERIIDCSSAEISKNWRCYRCRNNSSEVVITTVCRNCPMRGGAFIPAINGNYDKGEYAHVICSLLDRESKILPFNGVPHCVSLSSKRHFPRNYNGSRNPNKSFLEISLDSDYTSMPSTYQGVSKNFQCEVCEEQGEGLLQCISCNDPCPMYFHATCGRLFDVIYERRQYPSLLSAMCTTHGPEAPDCYIDDPITIGEEVSIIVKNQLLKGIIAAIRHEDFQVVDYVNGQRSERLLSENIINCECNERLCDKVNHINGSIVYVKLNNVTYPGYYRGRSRVFWYTVKYDKIQQQKYSGQVKTSEYECEEFNFVKRLPMHTPAKRGRKRKS